MKNSVITIMLLCLSLLASAQLDVKLTEGLSTPQIMATTNIEVNYSFKSVSVAAGYIVPNTNLADLADVFYTRAGWNIRIGEQIITPSAGAGYHAFSTNSTKYQQKGWYPLAGVTYQSGMLMQGRIVASIYRTRNVTYVGAGISYTFKSKRDGFN